MPSAPSTIIRILIGALVLASPVAALAPGLPFACRKAYRTGVARAEVEVSADRAAMSSSVVETQMHENGALEIRLNRPKKFNSLDSEMLTIINAALDAHLGDGSVSPSCAGVLITAVEGRAFCAGGDVNHLASLSREDKVSYLHLEYTVQQKLLEAWALKSVPVVTIADGIIMGAGAGLWMASSLRVATNRTLFAMPEANIGISPDAGCMHFLRTACAPSLGLYFALTGKRLGSSDVMYAGLATHLLGGDAPSTPLAEALAAARPSDWEATLSACGASVTTSQVEESSSLAPLRAAIDEAFCMDGESAKLTLPSIVESLQHQRESSDAVLAAYATESLQALGASSTDGEPPRACPTSILAAFHGMRLAHELAPPSSPLGSQEEANVTGLAQRAETARAVELLVNGRLAARADFEEGVACTVGRKKGEKPQWAPVCSAEVDAVREVALKLTSEGRLTLNGARDELLL